jgi:hypothetical protein
MEGVQKTNIDILKKSGRQKQDVILDSVQDLHAVN